MTIAASRREAVGATADEGIALQIWASHPFRMHDTAARGSACISGQTDARLAGNLARACVVLRRASTC
jgi:hypothetical protein